jgi:hypothetical protein
LEINKVDGFEVVGFEVVGFEVDGCWLLVMKLMVVGCWL